MLSVLKAKRMELEYLVGSLQTDFTARNGTESGLAPKAKVLTDKAFRFITTESVLDYLMTTPNELFK